MAKDRGYTVGALAAGALDDDDEALLRQVALMWAEADPVPDSLVDRLQFDLTLDALHAEIAKLERLDGLVGARGGEAAETQTITFNSRTMTTMVTVTPVGADSVRIDGWIAPGGGVDVELRIVDDTLLARADADGRFVFEDVPRGLAKFVLRDPRNPALAPVVTPSIQL